MWSVIIGVIFLITLLTLTSPLINRILSPSTMNVLENGISNIEFFVGSDNLNIFLVMISVIIIFTIYRRANKFFHGTE